MVQLLFESKNLLPTKEELAGILWSIWNARYAYIFRSRQPQATMVVDEACSAQKIDVRCGIQRQKSKIERDGLNL